MSSALLACVFIDPMEDQFEKRANAKKERVAKNEVQRLRNIARSQKGGLKAVHRGMFGTFSFRPDCL